MKNTEQPLRKLRRCNNHQANNVTEHISMQTGDTHINNNHLQTNNNGKEHKLQKRQPIKLEGKSTNKKKKHVMDERFIIVQPIQFNSPFQPGRGYCVVEPTQMINLLGEGTNVSDDIINSYMILLVESQKMYIRIVNSSFLPTLKLNGWQKARHFLKQTNHAQGDWTTSRLIFIPGFVGAQIGGHWINIIIENIDETKRMIYVADSLGILANYDKIVNLFNGTPFQIETGINQWKFLNGMIQEPGSNDCSDFIL